MGKSNKERAIFFDKPDAIPVYVGINDSCWHHYPQEFLVEMQLTHPYLFPGYKAPALPYTPNYGKVNRKDEPYTDDFGCLWKTLDDGITGTVVGHPLENLDNLENYTFPNPEKCMGIGEVNWEQKAIKMRQKRADGKLVTAGLRHGHTFLQLSDLMGYDNLLFAMVDEDERLWQVIDGVEQFNTAIVKKYLDIGVDMFQFPEDLGMQQGPMLSPDQFRKYIKPSYTRMMNMVRSKGVPVHMHSDGDIRTLIDDIISSGVVCINLQDLVNGIDWIKNRLAGKVCIDLDIDRQKITARGTPQQIDDLIREEVEKLGSPRGGLMLTFGLYPGTPMENVKAVFDAIEKYAFMYS